VKVVEIQKFSEDATHVRYPVSGMRPSCSGRLPALFRKAAAGQGTGLGTGFVVENV
jgi:hypothetical protein